MRSGLLVEAEQRFCFCFFSCLEGGVLTFWYEADGWSGTYVRIV